MTYLPEFWTERDRDHDDALADEDRRYARLDREADHAPASPALSVADRAAHSALYRPTGNVEHVVPVAGLGS